MSPVAAAVLLAATAVAAVDAVAAAGFSDRRLVIAIGEPDSAELDEVGRIAAASRCELADRDVDLVIVDAAELEGLRDAAPSNVSDRIALALRVRNPATVGFELVLVGKDGGVKARADSPDALEGFLATIDTMPMRRAELNRSGGADGRC